MNKPLTREQVKKLPKGFTPTGITDNRAMRRGNTKTGIGNNRKLTLGRFRYRQEMYGRYLQ